jgi:hypothetical protein
VSSAQITLKQIMKIHRQVNISRRDVQHIMANGKVAVIHDRWLLLVLFWYESGGEHFCVCVDTITSATSARIDHLGWEHIRRLCFDNRGVCVQTFSAEDVE